MCSIGNSRNQAIFRVPWDIIGAEASQHQAFERDPPPAPTPTFMVSLQLWTHIYSTSDQTHAADRYGEQELPRPRGGGRPSSWPHGHFVKRKLGFIGRQFHWNILRSTRIRKYSGCRFQTPWGLNISSVRTELFLNLSVKLRLPGCARPIAEV